MAAKNYPVVVSCDWFSYSCSCQGGFIPKGDEVYSDHCTAAHFSFEATKEKHPYYEDSFLVHEGKAPVAIIFFHCKRAGQQFSCQVKVENSRLYYARWHESLQALIRALRWRILFVNRVDICADFNYFANGRTPLSFARDYLSQPTKNRPSFIRHSSNKVRSVCTRTLRSLNFETLSWGTRDSAVQVNLYNKSLELKEKSDKPWIRQRWMEAGLLHGEVNGKQMSVWRVEFSINPTALMLIAKKSNQPLGTIDLNNVYTPAALIETWNVLHPRYFAFHFLTKDAQKNPDTRVRDLPLVELFSASDCVNYRVKGVQYFRKSGRTEKLLLKTLTAALDEGELTAPEKDAFKRVVQMLEARYMQKEVTAVDDNTAADIIENHITGTCAALGSPVSSRSSKMWVRMLQSVHDGDMQEFFEKFREWSNYRADMWQRLITERGLPHEVFVDEMERLEALSGTEAYEKVKRAADFVVGSFLDQNDCLTPFPPYTPATPADVCPF